MFSIFRSRSLLASFFSISHVASFVNYFFSSFFVSSLGSSAPCDSLSILPNLPLPVNRFFCFFSFFFSSSPFSSFILPLLTSYTPCLPLPADLYINISQRCRYFWNSDQCRFSAYPDPAPDFAVRNADIQIMIVRRSVIAQAQSTFQQVKHFIHVTLLTSAKISSISRICRPVHSNSYNVVWSSFWYVCRHIYIGWFKWIYSDMKHHLTPLTSKKSTLYTQKFILWRGVIFFVSRLFCTNFSPVV